MRRPLSRLSLGAIALAAGLAAHARAEAGIVILKNGKVFIGRIDAEDVKGTDDDGQITMHEPKLYKGAPPVHGEQVFNRHDLRWWDMNADEPTDDYMKDHADDPIDQRYQVYIERYKDRKTNEITIDPHILLAPSNTGRLSPIPIPDKWGPDEISIRKPANWTSKKVNGIFIFTSDGKGTDGFVPRIHVFSVERAATAPSDQLGWVKSEIEKFAQPADSFDIKDGNGPPKPVRNGYDAEWTTVTRHKGKTVMALRQVHFREHRTYFVTCYAHESEFDSLAILFRACMSSLQITEGGSASATAQDRVDASGVKVGQTYRWKSATVPDQRTWEITGVDAATVTRKITTTAADGQKKSSESPENLGQLDPVSRIGAITAAPVNPGKTGTEQLTVSGQTFDCDIYEATANNKKYRVWLSKKFPVTIKVTVDGTVTEELAEIK